jgi:aspartate/methionine/tyrosine aminotransferase
MPTSSLSSRGALAADTPLRVDYDAFLEASENPYHPIDNPEGALALNIAENRLSWPELRARIETITRTQEIPEWVPSYTSTLGAPEFREAAAGFLEAHLTGCPIDPDHLGVSAGATSVIEMTGLVLAEAGDVAVIPAPCYPVYSRDLGNVADVERYDLVTHQEISEIAGGPVLTVGHLERALRDLEAAGRRFRMLILTTPDNPTGGIHAYDRLVEIADWCVAHQIHLVVNEIYGLSLIDTDHAAIRDDYPERVAFRSFANHMADQQSDYLHLWWAVSKDLGISGFRVGLVHSRSEAFLRAYENLNLTHGVSNHTQWVLQQLFEDEAFMRGYVARNQARLTEAYALVVRRLKRMAIPYVPSRGSLFVWVDLSELMDGDSSEAEIQLWNELFRSTGVLVTPGEGFGHTKHGLFRVVYPCVSVGELEVALDRLERFVVQKRKR